MGEEAPLGATFLRDIIELAVAIELECAGVYEAFASQFADHEELALFWRLYAEAERYHAASIRIHQATFGAGEVVDRDRFPMEAEASREFLKQLRAWRQRFARERPTREEAFAIATRIESDIAELHGRTQFFDIYPQFRDLFEQMVEEDLGHRHLLQEAAERFTAA